MKLTEEQKKKMKEYRKLNRDKINKKKKEYYYINKKKILIKAKEYYQKTKIKRKKQMKEYRNKNKNKINKQKKEHYKNNKEKILQEQKEYRNKNKEVIKIKAQKYYKENKDEIKKNVNRYYTNNIIRFTEERKNRSREEKDKINERKRNNRIKRIQTDPEFLLKERVRGNFKRCFRQYVKSGKTMSSEKYGFDSKAIIEYLKPLPKNIEDYEVHHIIPLHTFNFLNKDGTPNFEEIGKAFAPENHKLITIEEHKKIHSVSTNP